MALRLTLTFIFLLAANSVGANELGELRAELNQLKHLMSALEDRIEILEGDSPDAMTTEDMVRRDNSINGANVAAHPVNRPTENKATLKFKGDLRLRSETISIDSENQQRSRLRARASILYSGTDLTAEFGLVSGGDNPVAANQTLGDGGSTKPVQLDLAYIAKDLGHSNELLAGKMRNPLFRPGAQGLVWDTEYRPEGLFVHSRAAGLDVTGGLVMLESDSAYDNRQSLYVLQGHVETGLGEKPGIFGLGYYQADLAGRKPAWSGDNVANGNNIDCSDAECRYQYDYQVAEFFFEQTLSDKLIGFGHWIQNMAVDQNDTGYMIGIKLESLLGVNGLDTLTTWQKLENEATLALVTDSKFAGGGTGGEGLTFKLQYALSKDLSTQLTYYKAERDTYLQSRPLDYERFTLDFLFKY